MTTPTTQPADKITPAELRQQFDDLHSEIDSIRHDLETLISAVGTITAGIQHAATATPPAMSGTYTTMMIESITMTTDDTGKPAYKAIGAPYTKFGVRIWPETLPALGIDPAALKPGPNRSEIPLAARVLMNDAKDDKPAQPRKITGRA